MILILCGVSGSGKSTIGQLLASRLGWPFLDADDYHPAANRHKMASGIALTDKDREPWLNALHQRMREIAESGGSALLACSALKQKYRDLLASGFAPGEVRFALLEAPRELIAERLRSRSHAFMNPDLLGSQLATLEQPADAWRVSVRGTVEESVAQLLSYLSAGA